MQLFIRQQIFIEFLLCVLHGAGCWGYNGEQERYHAYLHGTYSIMGENEGSNNERGDLRVGPVPLVAGE